MHPVTCTNTNHHVTDLVNHEIIKNTKTLISREQNSTFIIFLDSTKLKSFWEEITKFFKQHVSITL